MSFCSHIILYPRQTVETYVHTFMTKKVWRYYTRYGIYNLFFIMFFLFHFIRSNSVTLLIGCLKVVHMKDGQYNIYN